MSATCTFTAKLVATFVPGDVPLDDEIRELHDSRAYTNGAPDGWWDINVWDLEDPYCPVGRSAFVLDRDRIVVDRLAVDLEHRGNGLGRRMIDLGQRLWGGLAQGAEQFQASDEAFWCTE